jgi:Glutamine amidotransferase domain/Asparagine synthase
VAHLHAFAVIPGESPTDYRHVVVPVRFGHLIAKYTRAHPIPPRIVSNAAGDALATLGFIVSHTDSEALLSGAGRSAAQSLEECEGEFVAAFADSAAGQLHIVNDRFASRPLYLLQQDDGVYFSSNLSFLLTMAGAKYRPDVPGWLEACMLGHTLGTRTTTLGVTRLRPASHMIIAARRISERQYWRLEYRLRPDLDPAAHSEATFEAFRAGAVRRARLVGRGLLALSGGLDSRLVAGSLPKDTDFSAFTFVDTRGVEDTAQTRAAAAVCAALGLSHHIQALPARFANAEEVIALTGGMRPYQHMAIVMAYIDEAKRQERCFLLGGGPGDVLAGSYIPSPEYLDPGQTDACVEDARRRRVVRSQAWSLIFRDEVIDAYGRGVKESLAGTFASMTGPTAAHRVTAWAMVHRQPAFTFTSVLHTHPDVAEAVCHLDYRYTDFMLQLPAPWLYQRRFYSYMLYMALPQLRHVPYANIGRPLSGEPPTSAIPRQLTSRKVVDFGYLLARRAASRIVSSVVPARTRARSLLFSDRRLLDEVSERMHSSSVLRDILDLRRCDDLLARTRTGTCPSEEAVGVLTSLCTSVAALGAR